MMQRVHVAVGVIRNACHQVLIAKRAGHLHQGGLWEFPGGKIEPGETVERALQRELQEELGISARNFSPLLKIHHDYPDKSVLLDVWEVTDFEGKPQGLQQQPLQWVDVEALPAHEFPQANRPIITALRLSREMMITGDWESQDDFLRRLRNALRRGVNLVQLRAHQCATLEYEDLFWIASAVCQEFKATLVPNTSLEIFQKLSASALHLNTQRMMAFTNRPVSKNILLGVSCHNLQEIRQAERIEADYITLAPVFPTRTHPGSEVLGLEKFSSLAKQTSLPVYALGGIDSDRSDDVRRAGAFGIAGIRNWWG